MNYQACLKDLQVIAHRGIYRGLDRVVAALHRVGDPQKKFSALHIAGTNGKGSTAAIASKILEQAGYSVGLTISPHVVCFEERIQIKGQFISQDDLISCHTWLKQECSDIPLTYFEWSIVIAFLYFAERKIDIAVLETGMGGRWDATNVVHSQMGIITNVSLDHEAILGQTCEQILNEKMQILKPGMIAWTGIKEKNLLSMLREHCHAQKIPLFCLWDFFHSTENAPFFEMMGFKKMACALLGEHQKQNAALAVGAVSSLKSCGFHVSEEALRQGLALVSWPGRLEEIAQKPKVILDGAHNRAGIEALANFIKSEKQKHHLVFGALCDRPFLEMLEKLIPLAQSVCIALFDEPRSFKEPQLREWVGSLKQHPEISFLKIEPKTWKDFCCRVPAHEAILVTGSLYLVAQVRGIYERKNNAQLL